SRPSAAAGPPRDVLSFLSRDAQAPDRGPRSTPGRRPVPLLPWAGLVAGAVFAIAAGVLALFASHGHRDSARTGPCSGQGPMRAGMTMNGWWMAAVRERWTTGGQKPGDDRGTTVGVETGKARSCERAFDLGAHLAEPRE